MAVQNALPVLLDLAIRAGLVSSDQAGYFSKEYMHRLIHLVQKALGTVGLDTPLHQAEAFLANLQPKTRSKGTWRFSGGLVSLPVHCTDVLITQCVHAVV